MTPRLSDLDPCPPWCAWHPVDTVTRHRAAEPLTVCPSWCDRHPGHLPADRHQASVGRIVDGSGAPVVVGLAGTVDEPSVTVGDLFLRPAQVDELVGLLVEASRVTEFGHGEPTCCAASLADSSTASGSATSRG